MAISNYNDFLISRFDVANSRVPILQGGYGMHLNDTVRSAHNIHGTVSNYSTTPGLLTNSQFAEYQRGGRTSSGRVRRPNPDANYYRVTRGDNTLISSQQDRFRQRYGNLITGTYIGSKQADLDLARSGYRGGWVASGRDQGLTSDLSNTNLDEINYIAGLYDNGRISLDEYAKRYKSAVNGQVTGIRALVRGDITRFNGFRATGNTNATGGVFNGSESTGTQQGQT